MIKYGVNISKHLKIFCLRVKGRLSKRFFGKTFHQLNLSKLKPFKNSVLLIHFFEVITKTRKERKDHIINLAHILVFSI